MEDDSDLTTGKRKKKMDSEDDEPSHGGGSKNKNKKPKSTKEVTKKNTVRLIESDPHYPKDIPSGSKHYEKFWDEELREVMNQGFRRICWTVASTRSLSARLSIEKKVSSLKYLSALHLLVGLYDKTDNKGGLRKLDHLKTFLEEKGAILEKDCKCVDPWSDMKNKDRGDKSKMPTPILCTDKHEPRSVFKVKELIVITNVVEKDLIRMVDEGPVAISIEYHTEFAKFKGDGVYKGPKEDSEMIMYHMLLCTAYGTTSDGIHYWKVQNSAGRDWGDNGFGKIIRETSRGGKPSLIKYIIYPVLLDHYVDED